jgi:RHS repeat-associated protein
MRHKIFSGILVCLLVLCWGGVASAATTFYHHDVLGTTLAQTDESGNVTWWANYYPYGSKHEGNSPDTRPQRYTGKELDDETGLYYFGARYYNPTLARFISVDPIRIVDQNIRIKKRISRPISEDQRKKVGQSNSINEEILLNPQRSNLYSYALNNPYKFVDPDGLSGIALDVGGGYGTGWGDSKYSDGKSAGSGLFIGVRPDSGGHAQLGGFVYQSETDKIPGARAGLGINGTYYSGDSRDFFKGDMNYTMLTLFVGSVTKYTDPSSGETTGWTISLAGKGLGLTGFEKGTIRSSSGALQE